MCINHSNHWFKLSGIRRDIYTALVIVVFFPCVFSLSSCTQTITVHANLTVLWSAARLCLSALLCCVDFYRFRVQFCIVHWWLHLNIIINNYLPFKEHERFLFFPDLCTLTTDMVLQWLHMFCSGWQSNQSLFAHILVCMHVYGCAQFIDHH